MSESTAKTNLRTAVIGVGHLGRIHARIYTELADIELVGVCDTRPEVAREVGERLGVAHTSDPGEFVDAVDAVSIVVPTAHHLEAARPFLEHGVHCLVEKPIATTLEQADEMIALAARHGALLQVGHVERFNPAVAAIARENLRPIFIEAHRLAPFTFRSTDVGVVLDLMIHDLDLLLAMVGSDIESVDAVGGTIFTNSEDVANARIRFVNGTVANITSSRVSLNAMRRFRIFSPVSYVSLDLHQKYALMVTKGPKWDERKSDILSVDPEIVKDRQRLMEFVFQGLLQVREFKMEENEPLREELQAFLSSVRDGQPARVSGEDGRRALAAAIAVQDALAKNAF